MTESSNIPDNPSSKPSHTNLPKSSSKKPTYKEHYGKNPPKNDGGGKTHRFGSLVFSKKQWERFIKQLAQAISVEIKRQQKRIKKAQEQLKKSIKGEPF